MRLADMNNQLSQRAMEMDDWFDEVTELIGPESVGQVYYDLENEIPREIWAHRNTFEQIIAYAVENAEKLNPLGYTLLMKFHEEHAALLRARDETATLKEFIGLRSSEEQKFNFSEKIELLEPARAASVKVMKNRSIN